MQSDCPFCGAKPFDVLGGMFRCNGTPQNPHVGIVMTLDEWGQRPAPPADIAGLLKGLGSDLERIQEGDRPLPWVMHDGCSYRRISSEPTRENPRSFADGNVLHATKCWHDGHPDLSMSGDQLSALVRLVNSIPEAAHHIAAQDAEIARLRVIVSRVQSAAKTIMIGEADELRRLREQHREWHLAIKSLDSEREANAILTAENEALRSNPETGHD